MPKFNRPGAPLREKTQGGFDKPATTVRQRHTLNKTNIDEEIAVDHLHINEELMDQPLLMKKYTTILAQLNKKVKSTKNMLELREAKVYAILSNDGKGRKVAEIESMVIADEDVQKLRIELYDVEEQAEQFTGIVRAIAQRVETLKEVSMNLRKEIT